MSFGESFPGFKLRLTTWGALYLVFSLVLGFAAVNTGNNALMATLGVALAAYAVSGTWSRQVLAGIEVVIEAPHEIFARRPAVFELELRNPSRLFPAYGLVVRDGDGRRVVMQTVVPRLGSVRRSVEVVLPRRGWVDLDRWTVEVLLPLGFFVKSKRLARAAPVLVFPQLLERAAVRPSAGYGRLHTERFRASGREGDVTQLRVYREGDELRQIHWKQSARQQDLIAMDRERQAELPVVFVVDPRLAAPQSAIQLARFEHLLSEVATAVMAALRDGATVGVVVGSDAAGPVRQRNAVGLLMRPLAEAIPQPADAEFEAPLLATGGGRWRVVHA